MIEVQLKAPFPWFGGKSRAAEIIWARFGNVPNYVEPFAGSLAVLLGRPHEAKTETVNDLDCYVANFWRAIANAPEETAMHADWPVNEADLIARHRWLVAQTDFRDEMRVNPEYFDAKIAGWWVWGLCSWIGSGWCVQRRNGDQPEQIPHLGTAGMGINRKLPHLGNAGMGINRKLPHLGNAGRGINRKLPHLGTAGRGINRKLPHLGTAGMGINRKLPHLGDAGRGIESWFGELSQRLRRVRIACGEWDRVLGDSVTVKHGTTAVLLDPPYSADEHSVTYSAASDVAAHVREWAIANGENRQLRIALCGYEGEHPMPASWECVPWKARGGYGSRSDGRGRENSARERIWFSPACLRPADQFDFNA